MDKAIIDIVEDVTAKLRDDIALVRMQGETIEHRIEGLGRQVEKIIELLTQIRDNTRR